MALLTSAFRWLRGRLGRVSNEDIHDELRFHLSMEAEKLEREGMSRDAAVAEARRRFGGVDHHTEEVRDVRGGRVMEHLVQDTRYAFRLARRFPAFTAIVLLTLGVSIGANTAIFSVINATLLRPLPYPNGDRLAILYSQNPDKSIPRFSVSYADFLDWRAQTRSFSAMAAGTGSSFTLISDGEPLRLNGQMATSDYFDVLGLRAERGRLFAATASAAEAANEIVLTYEFWQRQFAGDPNIIGRRLRMASGERTVVGVLPQSYDRDNPGVEVVTVLDPRSIPNVENHAQHMVSVVARLKPGVTQAAAQADLSAVAARLAEQFPEIAGWTANVFMWRAEATRTLRSPLLVLLAAAGLVLLIGCINVVNLLLTRATLREREVALRQALGAARSRLTGQLLVESGELALGGALLGLVVAHFVLKLIQRRAPAGLLPADIALDSKVLVFTLLLAVATRVFAGLWPALAASSPRLSRALRDGGRSSSGGARALRARRMLVVAESSLALVLLVCAGLVIQSLRNILAVDLGFDPANVVTMRISLPGPRYTDTTQVQFFRDLQSRLEGRAGIEAVAAANTPPISPGGITTNLRIIGSARPDGGKVMGPATAITPGYFRAMHMRLLRGRDVAWSDPKPTIVVSQAAANAYWPGESPIGKHIGLGPRDTVGFEVVGVVNDTRARGITVDTPLMIYLSYAGATNVARAMSLVVRGRGDAAAIAATTRAAILEIDRTLPVYNVRPVTQLISNSLGQSRLNTTLLTIFAAVALILAAVGIYGVISYSVTLRQQEIGVRMALGASSGNVLALVLREGALLAVIGTLVGLGGAYFATGLVQSWLFGVGRADVATIAATACVLVGIALLASYLPARRAARVDPLVAMRGD
jgi:putative ABC transport system permease protein